MSKPIELCQLCLKRPGILTQASLALELFAPPHECLYPDLCQCSGRHVVIIDDGGEKQDGRCVSGNYPQGIRCVLPSGHKVDHDFDYTYWPDVEDSDPGDMAWPQCRTKAIGTGIQCVLELGHDGSHMRELEDTDDC